MESQQHALDPRQYSKQTTNEWHMDTQHLESWHSDEIGSKIAILQIERKTTQCEDH